MRLGGKVDYRLNTMFPRHSFHEGPFADIPVDKGVAGMPLDVSQVFEIAGVAEGIEIDHLRVFPPEEKTDEVRPDESRPACDQNPHRLRLRLRLRLFLQRTNQSVQLLPDAID